jgi:prophage tail gpP-like protein
VKFAEVDVSIDKMTRQFTLKNTEYSQSFFIGDDVEIYANNGILIMKGEIEYVSIKEKNHVYAGRNNAKYIVDCFADKTIQFSENQTVQSVLEEVASWFDLKVFGKAKMPKETIKTILIGDSLGESFMKIAKSSGQVITSDAEGNIVIESESQDGVIQFVYGENIRSRTFREDATNEYDRYIVVSQSNYLTSKDQDVDVQGEFGDGKFVKVIRSEDNLTIEECENLAENEYWKDRRRSIEYSVEVDNDIEIELNHEHFITDVVAGISTTMNLKGFVSTFDQRTDKLVVKFEKKESING